LGEAKKTEPENHWQVEWTPRSPLGDIGNLTLDSAVGHVVLCHSLDQAKDVAKWVHPHDIFGVVRIREVQSDAQHGIAWHTPACGEILHYYGEDGGTSDGFISRDDKG